MNRIKEVLKAQGRTQQYLVGSLSMSFQTISGYCRNERQPTIETLYKIAKLLGVEAKDLLVDNNELKK